MSILNPIPDIHFLNTRTPQLGIEILTLESLFKRRLTHSLEAPQRVHFYLIILFTHGTGTHSVDFTDYACDEKTLLLISKGQVQQFRVNLANTGYLVLFTPEFLYQNATEVDLFHGLQVFEHALFSPHIRLSVEQQQLLRHLCGIIQHEYQRPTAELSGEILRHLLRVLLLQVERIRKTSASSQRVAPYYEEFVAFRHLVERDFTRSRSVQYYARQLTITPKKINDLTRKVLNKTAKEFIEEQVVLEAQRLLAQGNMPIKEISYQLGFSEPTNLVKFFKKHTRISPAAFRRRFHPSD